MHPAYDFVDFGMGASIAIVGVVLVYLFGKVKDAGQRVFIEGEVLEVAGKLKDESLQAVAHVRQDDKFQVQSYHFFNQRVQIKMGKIADMTVEKEAAAQGRFVARVQDDRGTVRTASEESLVIYQMVDNKFIILVYLSHGVSLQGKTREEADALVAANEDISMIRVDFTKLKAAKE